MVTADDFKLINASPSDKEKLNDALTYLQTSPTAAADLETAKAQGTLSIEFKTDLHDAYGDVTVGGNVIGGRIFWDPQSATRVTNDGTPLGVQSPALSLFHELAHYLDPDNAKDYDPYNGNGPNETRAVARQNKVAAELNEPITSVYEAIFVSTSNVTQATFVVNGDTKYRVITTDGRLIAGAKFKGTIKEGESAPTIAIIPAEILPDGVDSIQRNNDGSTTFLGALTKDTQDGKAGDTYLLTYNKDGTLFSQQVNHADNSVSLLQRNADGTQQTNTVIDKDGNITNKITVDKKTGEIIGDYIAGGQAYHPDGTPVTPAAVSVTPTVPEDPPAPEAPNTADAQADADRAAAERRQLEDTAAVQAQAQQGDEDARIARATAASYQLQQEAERQAQAAADRDAYLNSWEYNCNSQHSVVDSVWYENTYWTDDEGTTYGGEIAHYEYSLVSDPIILNLHGSKVETTNFITATTQFDMHGTGTATKTGWATAGEGFLIYDPNNTGLVTGKSLIPGFDQLNVLAHTSSGVLDASNPLWAQLKVWVDANGDAVCDDGELTTLDQLGIVSIDLDGQAQKVVDNGNIIYNDSQFTWKDGSKGDIAGVGLSTASKTVNITTSNATGTIVSITQNDTTVADLANRVSHIAIPDTVGDTQIAAAAEADAVVSRLSPTTSPLISSISTTDALSTVGDLISLVSASAIPVTLDQLGITAINLNAQAVHTIDNGNVIYHNSSFTWADGSTGNIAGAGLAFGSKTVVDVLRAKATTVATSDATATTDLVTDAGFSASINHLLQTMASFTGDQTGIDSGFGLDSAAVHAPLFQIAANLSAQHA